MQCIRRSGLWRSRTVLLLFVLVFVCVWIYKISSAARTTVDPPLQQDVLRLDNRITQLEQRLYTIENRIRNLEQQQLRVTAGGNSGGVGPEDLAQLRSQIQLLQQRVIEDECALATLDERTLSPAMRASHRSSRGTGECRINFDAPLRLPDRR
jgi:hypothetical protein